VKRRFVGLLVTSLLIFLLLMGSGVSRADEEFVTFLPIISNQGEIHGEWIAYIGVPDWNVWLISADGARLVKVTDDGTPLGNTPHIFYWGMKWSPNGQMLAFQRRISGVVYEESIQVYDLSTKIVNKVVTGLSIKGFDWTPDSRGIVYAPMKQPISGLYVVELQTRQIFELVPPVRGISLWFPQWSPDGRYLAFEEVPFIEGHGSMVVYDTVNNVYPLPYGRLGNISWAPNGLALAYDNANYPPGIGNSINLKMPAYMGQSLSPLSSELGDSTPQFSPDGRLIAFVRKTIREPGETYGPIWLVDPDPYDGVPARQFTYSNFTHPQWSPDGKQLVAQAYCGSLLCEDDLIILSLDPPAEFLLKTGAKWPEWQP